MDSIERVLQYLYSDNTYPGWVQFWGLDEAGTSLSVFRGADRVGSVHWKDAGRNDRYITKNIMKRTNRRGNSQIFAYNSIVLDIDNHAEGMTVQQMEAAAEALRSVLLDRCEVSPSLFVQTGRGCQIWYLIEPVAASLGWKYNIAQDKLFDIVGKLIEDEGIPFTLDESVKDPGRVVRVPGSWNHKVQRFGSFEVMNRERYSLQELIDSLGGMPEKKIDKKEKKVKTDCKKVYNAGDYEGLCWKQRRTIESLCHNRDSMKGLRNTALYLYGAAVYQLEDQDKAAEALYKLNQCRSMRLSDREVEAVVSFYNRHGVTKHCTVKTFFKLLRMTPEEIETYNNSGARAIQRQEARDRKKERNNTIIKYRLQGYGISQIAEAVGVARGTVYSVLKNIEVAAEVVEESIIESIKEVVTIPNSLIRKLREAVVKMKEVAPVVPAVDPGGGLAMSG